MSTDARTATTPAPPSDAITDDDRAQATKDLELTRRFTLAIFADPSLGDQIPDGVVLELIPEGDPTQLQVALRRGIEAVRRGHDVYFKHIKPGDLPEPPPATGAAVGGRRTFFAWDGTIHTQEVVGLDGTWQTANPPEPVKPLGAEDERS